MKRFALCTALAAGLFVAGSSFTRADDQKKVEAKEANEFKNLTDEQFVLQAVSGSMFEIKSSQYALEQAGSNEVKAFARKMIADHTKAGQELQQLLSQKNIGAPQALQQKQANMLKELGTLRGADFDRKYMTAQHKAHVETVALFEAEAKMGKDAQLKAWAEQTLPTLREHMKMAHNDLDNVKNNTGEKPAAATPPANDRNR